MTPHDIQAISDRDQTWASLRSLQADIERLASAGFDESPRDVQLITVLARIVAAEIRFREREFSPD